MNIPPKLGGPHKNQPTENTVSHKTKTKMEKYSYYYSLFKVIKIPTFRLELYVTPLTS